MAIAIDTTTNGGTGSFVKSLTYSHTCTGSNLVLIVYVSNHVDTTTGVTYGGTAMTLIGDSIFCASNRYVTAWYLIAPATGANNVVVTSTDDGLINSFASSYTGVKQSGQPDGYTNGGNDTLTTSYSISHTTTADNCWTIMVGWNGFNGSTHASVGANTTLRAETSTTDSGGWMVDSNGAKTPAGAVSLTMTTSVNNNFRGKSFSIAPFVATQTIVMAVSAGSYVLTGLNTLMSRGYNLTVNTGSYVLTGINILIHKVLHMSTSVGNYVLTGFDAIFTKGTAYYLITQAGQYLITGIDVSFSKALHMATQVGAYTLTGINTSFSKGWGMVCVTGDYTLTGIDILIHRTYHMFVDTGNFIITGFNITFRGRGDWTWTKAIKHLTNWTLGTKHTTSWTNQPKS